MLWILPTIGGTVSQKAGYWQASLLGLLFCLIGLGCLFINHNKHLNLMLFGLAFFLIGNALFTPSSWCIVDHLYGKTDTRRESGFTLFYLIFNIGGAAGIFIINGIQQHTHSYTTAFGICIGSLLTSLKLLYYCRSKLGIHPDRTIEPAQPERVKQSMTMLTLGCLGATWIMFTLFNHPKLTHICVYVISALALVYLIQLASSQQNPYKKRQVIGFTLLCIFAIGFWVLYNLESSLLSDLIKDTVNRSVHFFSRTISIPAESFFGFEALSIVIIGLYLSRLWLKLAQKNKDPSLVVKFSLALLLISLGYLYLYAIININGVQHKTPALFILFSYLLFAAGELCIGPLGISMVGKLSPEGKEGILMGIWQLVIGVSAIIAGAVAKHVISKQSNFVTEHTSYANEFFALGVIVAIAGIFVWTISPRVKLLLGDSTPYDDTHIKP